MLLVTAPLPICTAVAALCELRIETVRGRIATQPHHGGGGIGGGVGLVATPGGWGASAGGGLSTSGSTRQLLSGGEAARYLCAASSLGFSFGASQRVEEAVARAAARAERAARAVGKALRLMSLLAVADIAVTAALLCAVAAHVPWSVEITRARALLQASSPSKRALRHVYARRVTPPLCPFSFARGRAVSRTPPLEWTGGVVTMCWRRRGQSTLVAAFATALGSLSVVALAPACGSDGGGGGVAGAHEARRVVLGATVLLLLNALACGAAPLAPPGRIIG